MPASTGPSLARRLQGWVAAAHPFPIAGVLTLTALLGIVSTRGEADFGRLALVVLAMLLSQLAIGWMNDYLDRETDARSQPSKPVPSGLVEARMLPGAIVIALIGSLAAGAVLGVLPLMLLIGGTSAGLAYDLGVKDTRASALPYVGGFALLPPFVWSALDAYRSEYIWLYAIGVPLVIAVHLGNALPDLAADAEGGRGGIVVQLGPERALRLLFVCLLAPVAVVVLSFRWLEYGLAVLDAMLVVYALLLGLIARAYRREQGDGAATAFRLIVVAGICFSMGWLLAVA